MPNWNMKKRKLRIDSSSLPLKVRIWACKDKISVRPKVRGEWEHRQNLWWNKRFCYIELENVNVQKRDHPENWTTQKRKKVVSTKALKSTSTRTRALKENRQGKSIQISTFHFFSPPNTWGSFPNMTKTSILYHHIGVLLLVHYAHRHQAFVLETWVQEILFISSYFTF